MRRGLFFGSLFACLGAAFWAFAQDSAKVFKAESFFFKTTGTLKPLLSESAYQAVINAAKASGYDEDEIEVTIIVTDRKRKFEQKKFEERPPAKPYAPKPKKFE
ncbi:MAG: hypothetical protein NZM06_11035 [Chloroherpetonaceae bacterium]|nr:hypothetical protein [Chloroherpetonaceae bacterium]MDW8438147.1 hypothetical protein [Chloroherpetonaceae bacterium]